MPLLDSILDNKVLGREYKRGQQEGRQEGELRILRRQIQKRFGPIPDWAQKQLAERSTAELEELTDRVLDAPTIQDLFE